MNKEIPSTPVISLNDLLKILEAKNSFYTSNKNDLLPLYFHSSSIDDHFKFNKSKNFIFVARKGNKFDGHSLAQKVLNSGHIFIGRIDNIKENFKNEFQSIIDHEFFISVDNTEECLNILLEYAFKIDPSKFFSIAVTGTNGKTSVTQMCSQLLNELYSEEILTIGTLGAKIGNLSLPLSHVTTPDYPSFLNILHETQKKHVNKIVLEYTSHGLKENRLNNWCLNIGIFTNLTQDHLDYHKTMDDYRYSKQLLFNTYLSPDGTAIININNDEWPHFVSSAANKNRKLILVGNKTLHENILQEYRNKFENIYFIHIENMQSNLSGIAGTFILKNKDLQIIDSQNFNCALIGEFQFENILCACAVGIDLKFSLELICQAITKIKCIPGRLEHVNFSDQNTQPTVLVDYAHTPDALEKAILTCKKTLANKGKLITVFGCGGDRDVSKRPQMGKIAFENSDFTIVTSDNPRSENPEKIINDIFSGKIDNSVNMRESDRKKAIQKAISIAQKNDVILIAGKGHEDYQIIGTTKYPFSDVDVVKSFLGNT